MRTNRVFSCLKRHVVAELAQANECVTESINSLFTESEVEERHRAGACFTCDECSRWTKKYGGLMTVTKLFFTILSVGTVVSWMGVIQ